MTDEQREERACWKLEQGGYRVQKQKRGYLVTSPASADDLEDLAQLVAFAEAVRSLLDRQAHYSQRVSVRDRPAAMPRSHRPARLPPPASRAADSQRRCEFLKLRKMWGRFLKLRNVLLPLSHPRP